MPFSALPSGLRTRIAPTPSGLLHPGNGAAFLLTHGLARRAGGHLHLRIDDLDAERVRMEHVADIFDTLRWLGITWDSGPWTPADLQAHWSQARRLPRYQALLDALRAQGVLYACTCSRRTLAHCTCATRQEPLDGPERAWRLRVPKPCRVSFTTWPEGRMELDLSEHLPDPVLRQRNGRPAYQIASLADDVDQGITFIVRGADLLPSTACQLHVAGLLGLDMFSAVRFLHHPLVEDDAGRKLSKSAGAGSLRAMRESGLGPETIQALADDLLRRSMEKA